ncbi:pyridoxine/pyridoxamine 5'-phosphate oxidase isoform X2 [Megalopta genalis]|uniref:pyridoxine/pyridoxamine 5'-phosphate oxidase isoform X2 n=1 Tax=Megalopta genalis TaxID=115081 RepID=UPI003FD32450
MAEKRDSGFGRFGETKRMGSQGSQGSYLSDLAKIEGITDHPVDLFRTWHEEARRCNPQTPDACCLATTSEACEVSARNVVLREFDNDGFVIVTDRRSKKIDNIEKVPQAAMCYLWCFVNEEGHNIVKQVRVEGIVKELEKIEYQPLYDREPLYCKIRSHLCHQGVEISWDEQKQRHDEILDSVRKGETNLPMPDHFAGYKLFPTMMEFYYARNYLIGDRIIYRKAKSDDSWEYYRIAA